jgi:hypothetical protein
LFVVGNAVSCALHGTLTRVIGSNSQFGLAAEKAQQVCRVTCARADIDLRIGQFA